LTPDRSATVTVDPHHTRVLRVTVSGVAPRGPKPIVQPEVLPKHLCPRPTRIRLRVQEHDETIGGDLSWKDVAPAIAKVSAFADGRTPGNPDIVIWSGTVTFKENPAAGKFRLVIEEHEFISSTYTVQEGRSVQLPSRLVYAEIFPLDDALVS
ncbi:MAG: hypothetical protein H0U88_04930, partial [Chthoniobacterales bacterium]|nr:hypothetical protein [Chthoniobacterales bacterium]